MEEDGTDRFERADTDSRHTLYPQRWRQTERERRFSFNKQKTLDATLFSTLNADQMMISCTSTITKKEKKKKKIPKSTICKQNPPSVLSGTLGLGVDAAEISSWRNPPNGG